MNESKVREYQPPFLFEISEDWYERVINVLENVYKVGQVRKLFPPNKLYLCVEIRKAIEENETIFLFATTETVHGLPFQLEDKMANVIPLGEYNDVLYFGTYQN